MRFRRFKKLLLFKFLLAFSLNAFAEFDCVDLLNVLPQKPQGETFAFTPVSDFALRDLLPRSDLPRDQWSDFKFPWGPCPATYPRVVFPDESLRVSWSRRRVIAAAKKFVGTPYQHFHIPEMGGLDCSNFAALVYNYAFGIRFSSKIDRQAREAGRQLSAGEALLPGDLLYTWSEDRNFISHVMIFVEDGYLIDSTGPGVRVRQFAGWYKDRFAWARRVIE